MALLNILTLPDKRLKTVAKPVVKVTEEIKQLAGDMLETMYAAPGIGLAATQVNQHIQLVVMDISEERNEPRVFINPKITARNGEQVHEEGCLSVPGIYADVKRAEQVTVEYMDLAGQQQSLNAAGLLAVCIQHEMDHLKGIVFLDHLSVLKRKMALKKLAKVAETVPVD
ncbi:peptide deformylase [Marinicella pacifica]|uniref:Peptide deformylase n=1 Tax=Marinicella pacifica TaxID=1171543 RepID=A0A917CWW3_9GAMM|nr:peptide deformylase [Marinicella pacifica]GGG01167.1 peptide deformylase [Marinicella pacifica]